MLFCSVILDIHSTGCWDLAELFDVFKLVAVASLIVGTGVIIFAKFADSVEEC